MKRPQTRKRLTRQIQQESISRAQFTEAISSIGWLPAVPTPDLGEDFSVHIYIDGEATGANIYVQLKSTTKLANRSGASTIPVRLKVKDLVHWASFALPVILVIWDVGLREGRWVMVKDVLSRLDRTKPGWSSKYLTVTAAVPSLNTTDPTGLRALQARVASEMLPLILKDSPIDMNLKLSFPHTAEGERARVEIEKSFKEGTPASIQGLYIQEISFSGPLQKWLSHISPNAFQLEVGPSSSPQTSLVILEAIGRRGTVSSLDNLQLTTISAGSEIVRLSNAPQKGPVLIELVLAKRQDTITFGISLSLRGMGRNAMETRKLIHFFEAIAEGAYVSLSFPGSEQPPLTALVPPQSAARPDPGFSDLVDQLCVIQEATGRFITIPATGISPQDAHRIVETTTIINTGVLHHEHGSFRPGLMKPALALIIDLVKNSIPCHMSLVVEASTTSILGYEVPLGPLTRSIRGVPEITLAQLTDSIASLPDDGTLTICFPDVTIIDIYPKWMIREANRIAADLGHAGSKETLLYGSLVWEEVLPPDVSIQLAVDGLTGNDLPPLIANLRVKSKFNFEIAAISTLPASLQERIKNAAKRLPLEI